MPRRKEQGGVTRCRKKCRGRRYCNLDEVRHVGLFPVALKAVPHRDARSRRSGLVQNHFFEPVNSGAS